MMGDDMEWARKNAMKNVDSNITAAWDAHGNLVIGGVAQVNGSGIVGPGGLPIFKRDVQAPPKPPTPHFISQHIPEEYKNNIDGLFKMGHEIIKDRYKWTCMEAGPLIMTGRAIADTGSPDDLGGHVLDHLADLIDSSDQYVRLEDGPMKVIALEHHNADRYDFMMALYVRHVDQEQMPMGRIKRKKEKTVWDITDEDVKREQEANDWEIGQGLLRTDYSKGPFVRYFRLPMEKEYDLSRFEGRLYVERTDDTGRVVRVQEFLDGKQLNVKKVVNFIRIGKETL